MLMTAKEAAAEADKVKGTVTSIDTLTNGVWITVQPVDKDAKPIRTRPACVTAA